MSFFDSEVVRAEMAEIAELQEEVYPNVFKFPSMNIEDQRYHVDLLDKLCEKQKVLYARLSLSDDPEAQQMKDNIQSGQPRWDFLKMLMSKHCLNKWVRWLIS